MGTSYNIIYNMIWKLGRINNRNYNCAWFIRNTSNTILTPNNIVGTKSRFKSMCVCAWRLCRVRGEWLIHYYMAPLMPVVLYYVLRIRWHSGLPRVWYPVSVAATTTFADHCLRSFFAHTHRILRESFFCFGLSNYITLLCFHCISRYTRDIMFQKGRLLLETYALYFINFYSFVL